VNELQLIILGPGFREFHKYLSDPSPSEKKYQEAVEEMKTANRQYAKRQTSWIRNKLLPAVRASKPAEGDKSAEVYLLDATGLDYVHLTRKLGED
jgi:tRNA dimethylallyltransferase